MECITLLGGLHGKPEGAAITVRSGLAIDGRGNPERASGAAIEIPILVGNSRGNTQRAEQRIVKLFRGLKIINTNHYMTKHSFLR
jgi:hypothetical protein